MSMLPLRPASNEQPRVVTCGWMVMCLIINCVLANGEELSPDELYSRMHRASVSEFRNAVGYYVVRNYDSARTEKNAETIQSLERSLEASLKKRIDNDRKAGVATNVKKLKAENDAVLEAAKAKYQGDISTRVERYAVEGSNFRIERVEVSNKDPLEKIRQDALSHQIDLSQPVVIAWNGKVTAEILRSTPTSLAPERQSNALITYKKLSNSPEFMSFGRDAASNEFFEKLSILKMPLSTEAVRNGDEPGVVLRAGDKRTIGILIELTALPEKGYAVASGIVKQAGTVMVEDKYSGFVQVSNGNWLPTHIVRSNYKLSKTGVPFLSTKREYLAIEPPKVNVTLPPNTFDLANTKEFQALKAVSPSGFKKRNPEGSPKDSIGVDSKSGNMFLVSINIVLIMILLAIFIWRRKKRRLGSGEA